MLSSFDRNRSGARLSVVLASAGLFMATTATTVADEPPPTVQLDRGSARNDGPAAATPPSLGSVAPTSKAKAEETAAGAAGSKGAVWICPIAGNCGFLGTPDLGFQRKRVMRNGQ
jgi:hypothetical protein